MKKKLIRAVNKIYKNQKILFSDLENFATQLKIFTSKIQDKNREEHLKYHLRDFLKNTFYDNKAVNTKDDLDFAIHHDKTNKSRVGVIIETKTPDSKEMITLNNLQAKSMYQCLLYYLQERISNNNNDIKHLIITNFYEWFIFDAQDFEKLFYENIELRNEFENWNNNKKTSQKTNLFYNEIAPKYIKKIVETHGSASPYDITSPHNNASLQYVHFDIKNTNTNFNNTSIIDNPKSNKVETNDNASLLQLHKIFSQEFLLKKSFPNTGNTLDKKFYYELLYIVGLEEQMQAGKKIIKRKKVKSSASLIENTITTLRTENRLKYITELEQYGDTKESQIENIALELTITWINRIIFLKLLESQLITYHNKNEDYKFLNTSTIKDYGELHELFFEVLAKKINEREDYVREKFDKIPYLNSSLFEISKLENETIRINSLKDRLKLPIFSGTVLKEQTELHTIQYIFNFLDAFDFTTVKPEEVQKEQKNLINASVLGLIFEKINGYKEGSFFTPGNITMYMNRETIRKTVLQKFKTLPKFKTLSNFDELKDKIEDRNEANKIINSIKICDPAVGSGHFLVSALNEIIAIKSELGILQYRNGNRIKNYKTEIINDELIITDKDTEEIFEYTLNQKNNPIDYKQELQEALFHEKETIIENCLFGVDINPNSVNICRLRLWIELLKNSYYRVKTLHATSLLELQTLPNIDINIKTGNSLISQFTLNGNGNANVETHGSASRASLRGASVKKMRLMTEKYKEQVIIYKATNDKATKEKAQNKIEELKKQFSDFSNPNDEDYKILQKKKTELLEIQNRNPFLMTEDDRKIWKHNLDILPKKILELEEKYEKKLKTIYLKAFEWRFEFPEALDINGKFEGFDIIVGNPPYISIKEIKKEQKKYFSNNFKTAINQYDLYTLFIERSFHLLKEKGVFAMITSNTYFANKSLINIRKFLLQNTRLIKLVNLDESIFTEAKLDVGITFFSKEIKKNDYKINIVPNKKSFDEDKSYYLQKNDFDNSLNSVFTINIRPFDAKLFVKIKEDTKQLGSIANINRGIEFGSNSPEIKKNKTKNNFPIIVGNCIEKYKIKKYAGYTKFIENNKSKYKDIKLYNTSRILVQRIRNLSLKKRLIATFIKDTILCTNTLRVITLTDKNFEYRYILALLNSKLINYYFLKNFLNKDIYAYQLATIPIKKVSKTKQQRIIKLVKKIEISKQDTTKNTDTSKLENEINILVYKLYDLTEEEIKIIENETT